MAYGAVAPGSALRATGATAQREGKSNASTFMALVAGVLVIAVVAGHQAHAASAHTTNLAAAREMRAPLSSVTHKELAVTKMVAHPIKTQHLEKEEAKEAPKPKPKPAAPPPAPAGDKGSSDDSINLLPPKDIKGGKGKALENSIEDAFEDKPDAKNSHYIADHTDKALGKIDNNYFTMLVGEGAKLDVHGCKTVDIALSFGKALLEFIFVVLACITLLIGINTAKSKAAGRVALCLSDILMIACGAFGALTVGNVKWVWWFFGMYWFLHIIFALGKSWAEAAKAKGGESGSVYSKIAGITVITWFCYPIIWVFAEGFGNFSVTFEHFQEAIRVKKPKNKSTRGKRGCACKHALLLVIVCLAGLVNLVEALQACSSDADCQYPGCNDNSCSSSSSYCINRVWDPTCDSTCFR